MLTLGYVKAIASPRAKELEPLKNISYDMDRRDFILTGAAASVGVTAGCLSDEEITVADEDRVETLPRPTLGDPDANLRIQVFEDYMCPACATYYLDHFPRLRDEYIDPGHITYEFYDYPIPVSNYSRPAANVARYVQDELGAEAFWEYKTHVYQNQDDMSESTLIDGATDLGADADDAEYAYHGVYDPLIDNDKEYGREENNVGGTPWVLLNGGRIERPTFANVSAILDDYLDE